jgi:hypothetical protein
MANNSMTIGMVTLVQSASLFSTTIPGQGGKRVAREDINDWVHTENNGHRECKFARVGCREWQTDAVNK